MGQNDRQLFSARSGWSAPVCPVHWARQQILELAEGGEASGQKMASWWL